MIYDIYKTLICVWILGIVFIGFINVIDWIKHKLNKWQ